MTKKNGGKSSESQKSNHKWNTAENGGREIGVELLMHDFLWALLNLFIFLTEKAIYVTLSFYNVDILSQKWMLKMSPFT